MSGGPRTLRACVEWMTPAELDRPEVRDLCERYRIGPVLAVPGGGAEEAEHDRRALEVVATYAARGLAAAVWPLLDDASGYFPSPRNAGAFALRVGRLLAAGAAPAWLAIDLEPPLAEIGLAGSARLADALRGAMALWRSGLDDAAFVRGAHRLRSLTADLHARGVGTLAYAIAFAAVGAGLERACQAPLGAGGFGRVAFMTYGSVVAGRARGLLDLEDANDLAYRLLGEAGAVGAAVGLVAHGKLGDEPVYSRPAELAAEVAAVTAAGVTDLTLYSLEGVLASATPGAWLDALGTAPRRPRSTTAAAAAHAALIAADRALAIGAKAYRVVG